MSCHWEELHLTASPLKFFKELSSLLALSKVPALLHIPSTGSYGLYSLSPSLLAAMMYYYAFTYSIDM